MTQAINDNIVVQRTRKGLEFRLPTTRFTRYSYRIVVIFSVLTLAAFLYFNVKYIYFELRYFLAFSYRGILTDIVTLILSLFVIEYFLRTRLFAETIIITDVKTEQKPPSIIHHLLHPGGVIHLTSEEATISRLTESEIIISNSLKDYAVGASLSEPERKWVSDQLRDNENAELTLISPQFDTEDESHIRCQVQRHLKTISYPVGRMKGALERVYIFAFGILCFFKIAGNDFYEIERLIIVWKRIGFDAVLRRGREIDAAFNTSIELLVGLIVMLCVFYFARRQRMEKVEIRENDVAITTGCQPTGLVIAEGRIKNFIFGDFLKPKKNFTLTAKEINHLVNEPDCLSFQMNGKTQKFACGLKLSDRLDLINALKAK